MLANITARFKSTSAAASETPTATHSNPVFPLEVASEVIQAATSVPDALNRQLRSPIDSSELLSSRKLKEEIKLSEQTTMIFEQVSREWCAEARRFKFEVLVLNEERDWSSPTKQLMQKLPDGNRVGVRVRRLELNTSAWTRRKVYAAEKLLQCCTELDVLYLGSNEDGEDGQKLPYRVLFPIFLFPSASLHSLFLLSPLDPHSAKFVFDHLPSLNLHVFSLRLAGDVDPGHLEVRRRPAILPKLNALHIFAPDPSEIMHILNDWRLPALSWLSLREQTLIQDEKFTSFFVAHGERIKILEVDCISSLTWGVFQLCPNLVDFVTDVRFAVINQIFSHPNVERIGFRGFTRAKEDAGVRGRVLQCFDFVFPFLLDNSDYPNLHTIRFLDFDQRILGDQGWFISEARQWAYWANCCKEAGKRLEDHDGQRIVIEVASTPAPFVDIRGAMKIFTWVIALIVGAAVALFYSALQGRIGKVIELLGAQAYEEGRKLEL